MLLELVVENVAVVDRARIRFHPGLNLLTGETGSGKSIVVDALGLLLGGRASADLIRSGAARARVAGIFDVREEPRVAALLQQAGLEPEDGELLIEREVQAGGKSRAFIGSRLASVSLLKELAPLLGDIHGQHDQQLLFSSDAQRDMLDAFGGHRELPARVSEIYRQWRATAAELEELARGEQETLRLLDLWQFQRKEIEAAELRPGEDGALEQERRVLQNLERLQESAGAAYAALYDSPEAALVLMRQAGKRLEEAARVDGSLEAVRETLRAAELGVQDASYTLRDYISRLESNPGRLEEVESRLAALDKLKRKYAPSIAEILAFLEGVSAKIDSLEHAGERMEQLRACQGRQAAEYERLAADLTAARREAGRRLGQRVETELASLGMERTVFRVELAPGEWAAHGADRARFLVSANVGEEPRSLEKVASGGEISRIALALKTCLTGAEGGAARTLVFDEVDAGIGGSAAEGVGRRLQRLAGASQVLCVTHLPQIAAFASHHYRVEKQERNGRTVALIEELDAQGREGEIARMLSGDQVTPEAIELAQQLLRGAASTRRRGTPPRVT